MSQKYKTMAKATERPKPDVPIEAWTQAPVELQLDKSVHASDDSRSESCAFNQVFSVDSSLFEGKILVRVKGVDKEVDEVYFDKVKRKTQVVWQGRFKKPLKVDDIVSGRKFVRPVRLKPPAIVESVLRSIFKRMAPGVEMDLHSNEPYVFAPFIASCQNIRADDPGSEPDITALNCIIEENVSACFISDDPSAIKKIQTKKTRRKNLGYPKVASQFTVDTSKVYTMEHYDHVLDFYKYEMDLGICKVDMVKILNGDPFGMTARLRSTNECLWAFDFWHERLLQEKYDD